MKQSATKGVTGTRPVSGLALGVSTLLSFGVALAAEDDAQRAESRLEEVIVTGSLITDPNRESPSPIVISTIESLQQSGAVALESALNQMPQFAPSGSAGNGGQGTGGHATVNLHGLGANRNLVLLDGRRLPLADIFGTVCEYACSGSLPQISIEGRGSAARQSPTLACDPPRPTSGSGFQE